MAETGGRQDGPIHESPKMKGQAPMRLVVASLLAVLAWAVFILLYSLLWSTYFSLFQNIVVAVVSLFITGIIIGLVWIIWGPKENWGMT